MGSSNVRQALRLADERGFTLTELLVAVVLLAFIAAPFYGLVVAADRGWSLLQGQLDTQQNPRVALERLINDVRQSTDYSITGGTQLTPQKMTILVCPAGAGGTTLIVENATDIVAGTTVLTLTTLATQETGKTVTAVGATTTCGANGASGTSLTISPALTTPLFPYGTLAGPIPVAYGLSANQVTRAGAVLADNVSALSFTQQATSLASAAAAGATSISVTNTTPSTSPFAVGALIFVESEIRAVTAVAVGATTTTVTLDQGLFSAHGAGAAVRQKLATAQITSQFSQPAAGGTQVQQVMLPAEGAPRDPPLK